MRVAYLISKYPAVSHTFILREVVGMREKGIAIEVASINAGPSPVHLTALEQAEAAQTFYIKAQGPIGALKALAWCVFARPAAAWSGLVAAVRAGATNPARMALWLFYLLEAAILVRWMHKRNLSHVHVHFASQAASVALLASYFAPITLSMTVHGPDEFYDVPGSFLAQKVARASFVVCISHFAQSQMMKVSRHSEWAKFEVARLGVDTSRFQARSAARQAGVFEIVCVGRLVETKGQHILISAVHRLLETGRRVHLTLVGDGPDRASLQERVKGAKLDDSISFAGSVNQDHIQSYYRAADIFALASFAEGIPVVLMEAMAMELPCVATHINGIPELIRDGVDGLLVAPSDVDGLVSALGRLLDDEALRGELGTGGRMRIQQAYEAAPSSQRLSEIFLSRLGQKQEQVAT